MATPLHLPDLKGTEKEQLRRLKSYLYQLVPQLQWALDNASVNGAALSSDPTENASETDIFPSTASRRSVGVDGISAELGLSDAVSYPARIFGRGGAGCRFLQKDGRVSVAFCCAAPESLPVRVSASPLPEAIRPKAPVSALCHAEFSDGSYGIACACVSSDGYAELLWASEAAPISAVDGSVEWES